MKKETYQTPQARKVELSDLMKPLCVSGMGGLSPMDESGDLEELNWGSN